MKKNDNSQIIQKWIDRVAYDMDTAKAMLHAGKYIYVIFMCQQSLEKCLKGLLAFQQKEIVPIHNLRRLAEYSGIIGQIEEANMIKLDFLSRFYINSRYKEDLNELSKGITEKVAQDYLKFTEEFVEWLYQKMKQ
jgi:HEPN domain-containing protein